MRWIVITTLTVVLMATTCFAGSDPAKVQLCIEGDRIKFRVEEKTAPVFDEIFIFDGTNACSPEPTLVTQDAQNTIEIQGFSGQYPIPLGISIGGYGSSATMWGVFKNTILDIRSVKQSGQSKLDSGYLKHVT